MAAPRHLALACLAALPLALAACGDDSSAGGDRPVVVATAPQVEVLAEQLAGDGLDVRPVVAATADVHELELKPSQVRAINDAELILRPGRDNDAWAAEALDAAPGKQVDVAADVPGGARHWWMDPTAVVTAATEIAAQFDALDPAGKTERAAELASLSERFAAIDRATAQCLERVPAGRRRIVTDHDAIGAFARRYGLDVVGTISPGSEPEAAPSAKHLVELEQLMRERGVAAVFPIAPHGSKLVPQVAERGGATVGDPLWADALPGAEHGDEHGAHEEHAEASTPTDGDHGDDLLLEAAEINGHAVAEALGASGAACRTL